MPFIKAEKRQSKLRLGITGPSGSGKTFTALLLAKGIGGKIAFADTEHGSASLYADKFDFDVLEITPPYSVDKFLGAIRDAEEGGYGTLILDSITHEWQGDGSLMDKKDKLDQKGGNSFTNFGKITPDHDRFIAGMLSANLHLIATMRSKTAYVLEENDKGRQAPKKMGMAPVQRDGMEYEFTTVFDMTVAHDATVSKDRSGIFDGQIFRPSEKTGRLLSEWLAYGTAPKSTPAPASTPSAAPAKEEARAGTSGLSDESFIEARAAMKQAADEGGKEALAGFWKNSAALRKRMNPEQLDQFTVLKDEYKSTLEDA